MKDLTKMDNVEFVAHIMQTGSPMNQLFVLDALDKWSSYIIKNEAEVLKSFENSIIYGPAWVAAAKHVQEKFNARDGKKAGTS